MRLLIDGDACPNKEEVKNLAQKYGIEMIVFADYAHLLEDDYYHVVHCEVGRDSVDMQIINQARPYDLVVTQDYGLASLLLGKQVKVIHVSGMIINISAKQRRAQKHLKGPSKRTLEIKNKFLNTLENLLENKDII